MKKRQRHYGEYCMIVFCVGDWSIQIEYFWLQYLYNVKWHAIPIEACSYKCIDIVSLN